MKKNLLLLASLTVCLFATGAFAADTRTTGATTLTYEGNQEPDDDEFLYVSKAQYDMSVSGWETSDHQNSGYGTGYECDKYDTKNYKHGETLTLAAGHVFEGQVVQESRTYECGGFINDKWTAITVNQPQCETKWGKIAVGSKLSQRKTRTDCSGMTVTDENAKLYDVVCNPGPQAICQAYQCNDGSMAVNGKCVAKKVDTTKYCENGNWKFEEGKTLMAYRTAAECDANGVTKTDNNGIQFEVICPKAPNAICKAIRCGAGYQERADANGKCIKKGGAVKPKPEKEKTPGTEPVPAPVPEGTPFTCPENLARSITAWKAQCLKFPAVLAEIEKLEEWCRELALKSWDASSQDEIEYNNKIRALKDMVSAQCVDEEQTVVIDIDVTIKNIKKLKGELDALAAGFEKSVWRDLDGEFNTARLASDSIAAVVLGTTGGLVTSTIMKKKQVENGFEDLQCTIGGQVVATWGDQFSVGIQ